jgi:nicotinamidase-related amidase
MEVIWGLNQELLPVKITSEHSIGLVIDFQEKLVPHMYESQQIITSTGILLQGLKILEIPVIATQQYTKGLGSTVKSLSQYLSGIPIIEKLSFSCCGETDFMNELRKHRKKFVIIAGIETHVCVLQTATDLIESGYKPVIIKDCVSSRKPEDKETAISRIKDAGAIISSCESILFELCQIAGTDKFKAISKLVK